jgi:hypothetical protein
MSSGPAKWLRPELKRRATVKRLTFYITCLLIAMCATKQAYPQSANSATAKSSVVPNLVKFSGVAKSSTGEPLTGMIGITFALY